MRGRFVPGLLAATLGALALLAGSASARTASSALHTRTLTVHLSAAAAIKAPQQGPIEGLALDGTRAAFVRGVPATRACALGRHVTRWNLATGRTSRVSGARTCAQEQTSTGAGIFAVALTRSHSAWLLNSGGNTESGEMLFSSTKKPGRDKVLARSDRYGEVGGDLAGTWIGGLVSDCSWITYATWTTASDGTVTKSALWRISGSTKTQIAEGSGAVVAASADGGHIALLRTDGTVAVYTRSGTLLQTIADAGPACTTDCPGEGIALTGKLVAVLTESRPGHEAGSIEVYDRTNGELLHNWASAGGYAWQFDAYRGIAVYAKGARLHALDLASGKDVVVARRDRAIDAARFDQAGLLYYLNGPWSKKHGQSGKLVFVPFRTVAAELGR